MTVQRHRSLAKPKAPLNIRVQGQIKPSDMLERKEKVRGQTVASFKELLPMVHISKRMRPPPSIDLHEITRAAQPIPTPTNRVQVERITEEGSQITQQRMSVYDQGQGHNGSAGTTPHATATEIGLVDA
jgi:hypothetical protein